METIIAGRFDTEQQAERTVRHLAADGFHYDDASTFFVNPPGQHAQLPTGGDQSADAHSAGASLGTLAGAAAGSAAAAAAALAVPSLNVALMLGVIGVGAYTGSLAGTLAALGGRKPVESSTCASPGRHAGVMVAVRVLNERAEQVAVEVLREEGASDIESARGIWQDGEWRDFDPVAPPELVDEARGVARGR